MFAYNSYNYWFSSSEKLGGEGYKSDLLFNGFSRYLDIPDEGWCVQIGVHTGHTLRQMKQHWGEHRVRGIDLYNPSKDASVIQCDVNDIDFDFPIAYAENDVGRVDRDPHSRLVAFKWAIRNLVPGGCLLTTSNVANHSFGESVEKICDEHNCTWERLDTYKECDWAQFIDQHTPWRVISMMLVTRRDQ